MFNIRGADSNNPIIREMPDNESSLEQSQEIFMEYETEEIFSGTDIDSEQEEEEGNFDDNDSDVGNTMQFSQNLSESQNVQNDNDSDSRDSQKSDSDERYLENGQINLFDYVQEED